MANTQLIYKIVDQGQWAKAIEQGVFRGAEIDLADGYIHFSAAHQVEETANRHFAGVGELLLVAVDSESLGDSLKWEKSRGGDLFPHLYGTLDPAQVSFVKELSLESSGKFQFPDLSDE